MNKNCKKCGEPHEILNKDGKCLSCIGLKVKPFEVADMPIPKAWEDPNEIDTSNLF